MSCSSNSDDSTDDEFLRVFRQHKDKNNYSLYSVYESIDLEQFRKDSTLKRLTNEFALPIAAVVQNDVGFLKDLSDTPDWHTVTHPEDGNSLLQIGINHKQKEVCDFLISLPDFPLDHENNDHMTALSLALRETDSFNDHISCELIKKGASLDKVSLEEGDTLLHHSLDRSLLKVSKLLMEMGCDVNAVTSSRLSPLWCCLEASSKDEVEAELVAALLFYGADPAVGTVSEYNVFEYAVKYCSFSIEEVLFYYTFDRHTRLNMHFEVLLTLADERSPFFYDIVKQVDDVILGRSSLRYYHLLFLIDVEYLQALINKCGDVISQVFAQVTPMDYKMCSYCEKMSLRNLDLLLESDLRLDTIDFLVTFGDKFYFYFLIGFGSAEESVVVENICYLLSYGLKLDESHLKAFYKRYKYGELVKMVLHMDIEKKLNKRYIKDSLLVFLYDVSMTLERYLQNPCPYLYELFPYFAHPKLQEQMLYYKMMKNVSYCIPLDQPKIPLLAELARNVFRSYFVEKLGIKSAKQFYGLLNGLPISSGHKKIITYETPLY